MKVTDESYRQIENLVTRLALDANRAAVEAIKRELRASFDETDLAAAYVTEKLLVDLAEVMEGCVYSSVKGQLGGPFGWMPRELDWLRENEEEDIT